MIDILSYNVKPFVTKTFMNWMFVPCLSAVTTMICLYFKRKRCLKTEVLFYEPSKSIFCEECHHNFSINCKVVNCSSHKTKKIVHCLENARKSIDICVFAISNEPIADAIVNAHKRGVLIRIIISNCILFNSKEIKCFQKLGINVKCQSDSQNSYMHNKFSIIDSEWLIHGSMNWTHQATYGNWENVIITNLECLVIEYSKGFEKMWLNFK